MNGYYPREMFGLLIAREEHKSILFSRNCHSSTADWEGGTL